MKRFLFLLLIASTLGLVPAFAADANANFTRVEDVIYGRKFGVSLTFDVFTPKEQNRAAVLFMVSGGFFSSKEAINAGMYKFFLDRGYTVFAIVHGSQPKFTIPEITQDIHRAVRYIRHNAAKYGVDPEKFGISGGSAGGHLSITMGTQGGPGKPDAKDPIDRESSAVQAVACFFPPTDFLNYGKPGEDGVGVGTLQGFKAAFGPRSDTPEGRQVLGREISPINYITAKLPPTLLVHGDIDKLVPIQQSEIFVKKAKDQGATAKLLTKVGGDHGWKEMEPEMKALADWFDEHLRGMKKAGGQ
jgi:acetyl esterase/lipase